MGRGLSSFQKEILALLSAKECVTIRALFEHFARHSASNYLTVRASLSRAISRLADRELVECISLKIGRRNVPAVRFSCKNLTVTEKGDDLSGSECEATDGNKGVSQIGGAD